MKTRRLLVTGGAGFIGTNFVQYWVSRHHNDRVVILDALTYAGGGQNLSAVGQHENVRFVRGDICDESVVETLMIEEDIDVVVNFAAESHVDRSIAGPDIFVSTNINGTHTLLKVARNLWLGGDRAPASPRFHQISTDEVYGALGPGDPAFTENSRYAPNSPYAATKAAADHLVRAYHRTYGLPATISNCSNNYGPYQYPEKFIPLIILSALNGSPIPIYGDGSNIRDWLHVDDHCRGIERVLEQGLAGEAYNIGGGLELTNVELVKLICRILDDSFDQPDLSARFPRSPAANGQKSESLLTFVRDRPGHDFRYALDGTKIHDQLRYVPQHSLDDGLSKTVAWFLENEPWWRRLLQEPQYREWMHRNYRARE